MVWDGRSPDSPVHTLSAHQAAVKAISWCPWQPKTLASGGGTNDREIRFWNTATGACINSVDTGKNLHLKQILLKGSKNVYLSWLSLLISNL